MVEENKVARVKATITLMSTQDGGRNSAIADGYRPHVRLFNTDAFASVRLDFGQTIAPGDTREVEVTIVGLPAVIAALAKGEKFSIHEGPKLVGHELITRIFL